MTTGQLVPPNATFLERVMDDLASRISDVPADVISTLWDPETCPADVLPFLAWAFSVDFWNPDWTEQTKREVVANSYQVHATKGTVGALKRALGPLGMRIALREWWEHDGEPHTFGLTATVLPGAPATEGVQRDLLRIVNATKPARSHLTDLRMAAEFGQGLGVGSVGQSSATAAFAGLAGGRAAFQGEARLLSTVTPSQHQAATGNAEGRNRLHGDATMASVLSAGTGTDGSGWVAGRNTLLGEAAAALTVDGADATEISGPAQGRRDFEMTAPLIGTVAAFQTADFSMPNEDDMGARIVLSGATFPETIITAVNGALVMIQGGKRTYLVGRPPQPEILLAGVVSGAAGASTVTFGGAPGSVVVGDGLILRAAQHEITAIAGTTITLNPPLATDMDGEAALRFRQGE